MKRSRLRLLPLTMLVAFLALGLKLGEVANDSRTIFFSSAQAEQAPEKPAETPATEAKPAEGEKKPEAPKTEGDAKPAEGSAPAAEKSEEEADDKKKREFSQIELDLLQSLASRRQELDSWSKQVQLKENMLIATERRINNKIDNLKLMKKEIEDLLALYNEQEDTKIRSLVKIYENMKPKDAARIFEELDMPVLLTVVDRMSERKVSPILAGMSPGKAKDLTVQLAEQRKLQKPRANAAANAAATSGDNGAENAPGTSPDANRPAGTEGGTPPTPDNAASGANAPAQGTQPAPEAAPTATER